MGRVLVVDDEPDIFLMVRVALQVAGHEPIEAVTGEAALDVLGRERVDIMLLDIRLPGIDGWEVLERARADHALRGLKIVMMSAHSSPGTKARAAELGCDAYLTKPFSLAELTDIVDGALAAGSPQQEA